MTNEELQQAAAQMDPPRTAVETAIEQGIFRLAARLDAQHEETRRELTALRAAHDHMWQWARQFGMPHGPETATRRQE